jgi:hypothetical protein
MDDYNRKIAGREGDARKAINEANIPFLGNADQAFLSAERDDIQSLGIHLGKIDVSGFVSEHKTIDLGEIPGPGSGPSNVYGRGTGSPARPLELNNKTAQTSTTRLAQVLVANETLLNVVRASPDVASPEFVASLDPSKPLGPQLQSLGPDRVRVIVDRSNLPRITGTGVEGQLNSKQEFDLREFEKQLPGLQKILKQNPSQQQRGAALKKRAELILRIDELLASVGQDRRGREYYKRRGL